MSRTRSVPSPSSLPSIRMSSIVRRIFQRFMKPTHFVGRDLEGNKYYEYSNANEGRPKRTVQYKRKHDMWTYVASGKRLPVQWSAWLTHTRPNPPTIEELQNDLARQRRVQMNAAILEARDRDERKRVASSAQSFRSQISEPQLKKEPEQGQKKPEADIPSVSSPARDPWAEAKRGSDEPESWNPVVRRK